jgi:hypothetical protein
MLRDRLRRRATVDASGLLGGVVRHVCASSSASLCSSTGASDQCLPSVARSQAIHRYHRRAAVDRQGRWRHRLTFDRQIAVIHPDLPSVE